MGHKAPKYYKKKKDALNQKQHGNYDASKDPLHLFTVISERQHHSHQWFLNSNANQHMSPFKNIFKNYTLPDNPKTIFWGIIVLTKLWVMGLLSYKLHIIKL
jgi:hypothetical protein